MGDNDISGVLGLIELGKRINGGKAMPIAANLVKNNDFMADSLWKMANNVGFHKHLRGLSLPSPTWRGVGQGVAKGAGQTIAVDEPIARAEYHNEIDEAALDEVEDKIGMRRDEDMLALEGLSQAGNSGLIYGPGSQGQLNGLFNRYYNPATHGNVIDNGGTAGNCMSILVVEWGDSGLYLVYPKGSKTLGVQTKDMGLLPVYDDSTPAKRYFAWVTQLLLHAGIVVRNDRAVQRVRRIKVGAAKADGGLDDDNILRALNKLPGMGRAAGTRIYASREGKTQMDLLAKNQTNLQYSFGNYGGQPITLFRGTPVRYQEGFSETESATLTSPF